MLIKLSPALHDWLMMLCGQCYVSAWHQDILCARPYLDAVLQVAAMQVLPVFFKLFECHDKGLRQLLFRHIIAGEAL